jgi:hypothetical protein
VQHESKPRGTPAVADFRLCNSSATLSNRPTVSNTLKIVQLPHTGEVYFLYTRIVNQGLTLPFNGVPLLARPLQRIVGGANLCLVLHLFAGG